VHVQERDAEGCQDIPTVALERVLRGYMLVAGEELKVVLPAGDDD
jgi:hypothetical protein